MLNGNFSTPNINEEVFTFKMKLYIRTHISTHMKTSQMNNNNHNIPSFTFAILSFRLLLEETIEALDDPEQLIRGNRLLHTLIDLLTLFHSPASV